MIFQDIFFERVILIFIFQLWPIIYCSIFAYRILKRKRTRLTRTLSYFFFLNAIAFLLPFLSLLLLFNPVAYALYVTAFYLLIFSQSFLIVFSMNINELIPLKKQRAWILFYGSISTYVFFIGIFFNGIRYDASTSWIPVFSNIFLVINLTFVTLGFVFPEGILAYTLFKELKGKEAKKRIKKIVISTYLEFVVIYLIILFNALVDNFFIKIFIAIVNFAIGFLAAFFISQSIGKKWEWRSANREKHPLIR